MTASTTTASDREPRPFAPAPAAPARSLVIRAPAPVDPRRLAKLVVTWTLIALVTMAVTLYLLGPLFQQRAQHDRFEAYRNKVSQASEEAFSLDGVSVPTKAPEFGDAVGILEVGPLQLQLAVIEGVTPTQTAIGPGHVPGTAGLGQTGNAVVVGRRGAFGGGFENIGALRNGDRVLVTTTQGFVVYRVDTVRELKLVSGSDDAATSTTAGAATGDAPTGGASASPAAATDAAPSPDAATDTVDNVFGKTDDNRLTLVTSASSNPLNTSDATVVVAKMEGLPYAKTPQNGRTDSQTGLTGDSSALAAFILVGMAYGATVAAAIYLYRRSSPLSAYVLTIAPLLCFTVLGAEILARLLPAWM